MKMKVLLSTAMAILLSLGFSNQADAQHWRSRGDGYHRGGVHYRSAPRVIIAVRPPVRFSPPPRHYGSAYFHHRGRAVCGKGHRGCNDRGCYHKGLRGRNYDRYDRDGYRDRDYRNYDRGYNRY